MNTRQIRASLILATLMVAGAVFFVLFHSREPEFTVEYVGAPDPGQMDGAQEAAGMMVSSVPKGYNQISPSGENSQGKGMSHAKSLFTIRINTVSCDSLTMHREIESAFAQKLCKRRADYGGFVDYGQMQVLFENDSMALGKIKRFLVFETEALVRYDVNEDNVLLLAEHPYISVRFAENIVALRSQKGVIKSADELLKVKYCPKKNFGYLVNYLRF